MSQNFVPGNDLERQLLDAQNGRIAPHEFIRSLVASEVFMPVYEKNQIAGFAASTAAQPLILEDKESGEKMLALFTSPDRAKEFVRDFPGYGGGLVAEFKWILDKLGVGYSITLNPGQAVGMELEAQDVAQLQQQRQ